MFHPSAFQPFELPVIKQIKADIEKKGLISENDCIKPFFL
jgi:hypothetical protein